MSRLSLLLIALLLATSRSSAWSDEPSPPETPKAPRLLLATGDFATGKLVDSDRPNEVCWQCDALTEKLNFPLSSVSAAYFPPPEKEGSKGDFAFELVGGDALTGSLISLTDKRIELQSEHLGAVSIERNQVRRIVKLNHKGETFFSGPNGLAGWSPQKADHPWKDEGGQLTAAAPGVISYAGCAIPPKVSIDIEASWQQKASFSFHVGSEWQKLSEIADGFGNILGRNVQIDRTKADKTSALFSLETWGDWIVIVRETDSRADVSPVVRLEKGPGRIHLRLLFDRATGRVAVYSAEGKLLGEATAPDEEQTHARGGLRFENKSGDLRVEYLAVHAWFGEAPTAVDASRSYLQTSNGKIEYCDSLTYDAEADEFVVTVSEQTASDDAADKSTPDEDAGAEEKEAKSAAPAEPTRIAATDVTMLSFQPTESLQQPSLRAALYDGSRISGELERVANGRLLLRRPGIDKSLELPIEQLRLLASLIAKPAHVDATGRLGRLEGEGVRLHGWLVDSLSDEPQEEAASSLRWQPQACSTSSSLVADFSGSVVYREPPPPANQAKKLVRPRVAAQAKPVGVFAVLQAVGAGAPIKKNPVLMNTGPAQESQLLWLRAGDRLPCSIESIDDRGVTFKSTTVAATFLPHDAVKAWERQGGRPPRNLDPDKRERLLTLPRMQRANPPTHLIESTQGDYLRGQLEELNEKTVLVSVRLETKRLAVDDVASIVWFDPMPTAKANAADDGAEPPPEDEQPARDALATDLEGSLQAIRADGVRLTFRPRSVAKGVINGDSKLLGECRVDVREVDQLLLGGAISAAAEDLAYHQWRLKPAADPQFVAEGDGSAARPTGEGELTDKPAPDFRLELLDGGEFTLSQERGKVVVLDFWASWCGPCMQSLPKLAKIAEEFKDQDIRVVAVNMQEDRDTASEALQRLEIQLEIALDVDGATGEKFAVSAIPHTVVIDRRGIVTAILVGGGPDAEQRLRDALNRALSDYGQSTP